MKVINCCSRQFYWRERPSKKCIKLASSSSCLSYLSGVVYSTKDQFMVLPEYLERFWMKGRFYFLMVICVPLWDSIWGRITWKTNECGQLLFIFHWIFYVHRHITVLQICPVISDFTCCSLINLRKIIWFRLNQYFILKCLMVEQHIMNICTNVTLSVSA